MKRLTEEPSPCHVFAKTADMTEIADIFSQFRAASINPPWVITIVFALAVSLITTRKTNMPVIFCVVVIPAILAIFVISFVLSVYLTEVNQISVRTIIKVLMPLIKEGKLEGII